METEQRNDDRAKFKRYLKFKKLKLDRCGSFVVKRDGDAFYQPTKPGSAELSETLYSPEQFREITKTLNIHPPVLPMQRTEI